MMDLRLSEAASAAGGIVFGNVPDDKLRLNGFSIDSRRVQHNDLFVALSGTQVDGHDFVVQAASQGASAALVERRVASDLPQIVVDSAIQALGAIALYWRTQLTLKLIGITGSNGKTTVKEMVASILRRVSPTLATKGNLNNELGVPLTLGKLDADHRFAVVEMGCGQAGDIRYLADIARPDVGVVTNAGPAHLERLGSIAGVARTKGELFERLPNTGVAVINADDDFADDWRERAQHCRQLLFGQSDAADVRDCGDGVDGAIIIDTPNGRVHTTLSMPGQHNRMNALAAASVAIALEIPLDDIAAGLATAKPLPGRLETHTTRAGWTVIDDTYNANPASLYAGLKVISERAEEAWLVLGDMAELGQESEKLHAQMGQAAADLGVQRLYTVGEFSAAADRAFGSGAKHFRNHAELTAELISEIHPKVVCLVKGSRSSAMENVVHGLIEEAS